MEKRNLVLEIARHFRKVKSTVNKANKYVSRLKKHSAFDFFGLRGNPKGRSIGELTMETFEREFGKTNLPLDYKEMDMRDLRVWAFHELIRRDELKAFEFLFACEWNKWTIKERMYALFFRPFPANRFLLKQKVTLYRAIGSHTQHSKLFYSEWLNVPFLRIIGSIRRDKKSSEVDEILQRYMEKRREEQKKI